MSLHSNLQQREAEPRCRQQGGIRDVQLAREDQQDQRGKQYRIETFE